MRRSASVRTGTGERGAALVIAALAAAILAAVAFSLVVLTMTETRVTANYTASREVLYAADGALDIAARELLAVDDWNLLLERGGVSAFVDGPPNGDRELSDGRLLDLSTATDLANGESRPWGPNNPRWQLFAFGRLGPRTYVVVWCGDDAAENDGDPLRDGDRDDNPGRGILALRAEAFGAGGAHTILEATVRRGMGLSGEPVMRMLSWHDVGR